MFGKRNIKAVKPIAKGSLIFWFIPLFASFVLLCFGQTWVFVLIPWFIFFVIRRLFFGSLKLKDGDIIYFYGLPGSGKSLTMARTASDNDDRFCVVNEEFSHYRKADCVLESDLLGQYSFPKHSMHVIDESSNDGFDNRTWSTNFADPRKLRYIKKIRHHSSCIMMTNQGREEVDKKMIDGLISRFYLCEDSWFWSKAVCLVPDTVDNQLTGQAEDIYRTPTLLERIFDPSMVIYTFHRIGSNLYETQNADQLPPFPGYIK